MGAGGLTRVRAIAREAGDACSLARSRDACSLARSSALSRIQRPRSTLLRACVTTPETRLSSSRSICNQHGASPLQEPGLQPRTFESSIDQPHWATSSSYTDEYLGTAQKGVRERSLAFSLASHECSAGAAFAHAPLPGCAQAARPSACAATSQDAQSSTEFDPDLNKGSDPELVAGSGPRFIAGCNRQLIH